MYSSIPSQEDSSGDFEVQTAAPPDACCCSRLMHSVRNSKKTAIAVLFIAFMLDLMLLTAVEPVLPFILRSISDVENASLDDVSATAVGVLNGAKPFTQILFNPLFGFLIDKYSHNVPMMVGFFFSLSSTLGFAYANNYYLPLFFRCCQGIGSSLLTISGLSMLSDVYKDPEARGKAMAVGFSGLAVGLVVGFPFGSILYDFLGRETPFLVLCGLIATGAIIRFCLMPVWIKTETKLDLRNDSKCCEELFVFLDPYIFLATGAYFFLCYGIGAVMGLGPLFLVQDLHAEQWHIGIIFLVGAISQCIFQYSFAACAFRIGWWLLSMAGLMLVGIGVAFYPAVTTLWMIFAPQTVYAAGIGLVMGSIPALLGFLADIRAQSRYGAVFALSDTGTNLGYFLGSTITGLLVSHFKYFYVFAASGACVFLYAFLCIFLRKIPRKYPELQEEEKKALVGKKWRRRSTITITMAP